MIKGYTNKMHFTTKVITACHDSPLDSLLWRLALELASLPLLELGGALAWCGGAPGHPCCRLYFGFRGLQIHVEELPSRVHVGDFTNTSGKVASVNLFNDKMREKYNEL